MMYIITIYLGLIILNYIAVCFMEKLRWDVLEVLNENTRVSYFRRCLQKTHPEYLLWLQGLVIVPFYGLIVSILFIKRYNQNYSEGFNKYHSLVYATIEDFK